MVWTTTKQHADKFPIKVDYTANLTTGETITSGSVVSAFTRGTGSAYSIEFSGSLIVSGTTSYSNTELQATIESGSNNTTYKLQFKALTSLGNIYTEPVYLSVEQK